MIITLLRHAARLMLKAAKMRRYGMYAAAEGYASAGRAIFRCVVPALVDTFVSHAPCHDMLYAPYILRFDAHILRAYAARRTVLFAVRTDAIDEIAPTRHAVMLSMRY